jgi:NADH-quinone oxidoreductase subunit H
MNAVLNIDTPVILWSALSVFGGLLYGFLIGGTIRIVMARIQSRIGPPIWQPYVDQLKLLFQRTSIRHGAMFYLAPVFRIVGGIGIYLLVPIVVGVRGLEGFSFNGDLLLIIYFMFFGCLGMALGAGESGHPHAVLAVSRGLSQMSSYELPFSLSVIALVAQAGSFSVAGLVAEQSGGMGNWFLFANPFAAAAGLLAFLGMQMYSPFDIVLAPQEIPIGPPTEYNSSFLFLMMSGRALFGVAKAALYMNLFLGGARSVPEALIKIFLVYLWSVFVGAVFPRFRAEQSVRFFLGWPTWLGVAGIVFAIVMRVNG